MLLLQKIKDQDLEKIKKEFPQLELIDSKQMTDDQVNQIDIIYGQLAKGQKFDPWFSKVASQGKSLKWIQTISAGVDFLPFSSLNERGVIVSNMSGLHSEAIAETVLGYLLIFSRDFKFTLENQRQKKWDLNLPDISQLVDKKVLIFGTGKIGSAIAKLLLGFEVEVVGINRHGKPLDYFDQVATWEDLPQHLDADYIISDLPLTEQTRGYFNSDFFDLFKNHPVFVNVGRGPSVVEKDLIAALKDGRVSKAGLDVFEKEPLAADSPLWSMDNVIVTPHSSALLEHYLRDSFRIFHQNLTSYLKTGKLAINQVDLKEGY